MVYVYRFKRMTVIQKQAYDIICKSDKIPKWLIIINNNWNITFI